MSSPLIPGGRGAAKAFTLIELLTVIAIIGVLAGITFGVMKGVQERSAIQQARTELATISTALENYKRQYGDYPQTGARTTAGVDASPAIGSISDTSAQSGLFNALGGKLGPEMDALRGGKVFVELGKFSLETTDLPNLAPTNDTAVANALLDPWGRRYVYAYKAADKTPPKTYTWTAPSFVLYSAGPDGRHVAPNATGAVDYDHVDNLDNIYANR